MFLSSPVRTLRFHRWGKGDTGKSVIRLRYLERKAEPCPLQLVWLCRRRHSPKEYRSQPCSTSISEGALQAHTLGLAPLTNTHYRIENCILKINCLAKKKKKKKCMNVHVEKNAAWSGFSCNPELSSTQTAFQSLDITHLLRSLL